MSTERRAAMAVALGVSLAVAACAGPQPAPATATALPVTAAAPTPTLGPRAPATTPTVAPSDIENAFLSNVDDLIGDATDLSVASCDDLQLVARENPSMLVSLHGYAAALKRASTSQAVLNTDTVKSAIADLDQTMGQLDGALAKCGIPVPTPSPP